MEIKYSQNPMNSFVFLNDAEKERLRYVILKEILEDGIMGLHMRLKKQLEIPKEFDSIIAYATKTVDEINDSFYNDELDQEVEHMFDNCISSLETHIHCGDCTCVPASCMKCHAESMAECDTIKGLGKHEGAKLSGYFRNNPDATAKDCLEHMKSNPVVATEDWHHGHLERWNKERLRAIEWLEVYIVEKLGEEL